MDLLQQTDELFFTLNNLDLERTSKIVRDTLAGGDDGELFLEMRHAEMLAFDDGRLKTASYDQSSGFGLRAVAGEAHGYAHAGELSEAALQRAADSVSAVTKGYCGNAALAPSAGANSPLYSDRNPLNATSFDTKIKLLQEMDAYARDSDSRVKQVSASLSGSWQAVQIMRADGIRVADIRPLVRINIWVAVEENGRMESGGAGAGGRVMLDQWLNPESWQSQVDEALRIAILNLQSVPTPAGEMEVVLGAGWPGVMLHEAVGHGLEGDFNRKGTSVFSGRVGQQVAAKGVTVIDDGTIVDRRGSITVDDEGTPSRRNVLIEDGILKGYMQDRQNARLMGVDATGNGRRESYAHAPMPRMTNTYMLAGDTAPASLVADLKDGIYAVGFGGGQVDITNGKFVFSCTEAYRVKDGVVGRPIKGATLIGDGATALRQIRGIGNDLALDPGIGNCGKAGQWVPVGVGQPSLLIGGLTVGGSA